MKWETHRIVPRDFGRAPSSMSTMEQSDLRRLAALLRQHNTITDEIAQVVGRPAERGHVGEFIAARIFSITLADSATEKGVDGTFTEGPLAGRTVNVKWYGKQEGVLDLDPHSQPDYYLVLTGSARAAASSRGTSRPWVIAAVYLFDRLRLEEDLRRRGIAIGLAASVRQALWPGAEVYPEPRNAALVLSQEQRDLLALFG